MTEYLCNECDGTCRISTSWQQMRPDFCPYSRSEGVADWQRVAEPAALESESIIHGYTFRAQEIEINTKDDVNDVIQQLQHCIEDLVSVEWPEDKERIAKLLQVTA